MRILSLTVRNYRVHQNTTVDFDDFRNLIGGANETGKSTLAEAMHRVLFCRHRAGGELQQSMRSTTHVGHPEVKLSFEIGGSKWTIEKRFSGTNGTILLSPASGASLNGDAAEEKLAQLIGNPDGAANRLNDLATRWSHLWVWQGMSGNDAIAYAADRKDALVQRLQQDGLAAVMQSQKDEAVFETITQIRAENFTPNGGVRANSSLDRATKALTSAGESLARAMDLKKRMVAHIADQEAAAVILNESTSALPGLREQLAAIQNSLAETTQLASRREKEQLVHQSAVATLEQLTKADRQLRDIRQQTVTARDSLLPAEAKLSLLIDQETSAREKCASAEASHRLSAANARLARQQHDLAAACLAKFEKAAALESIESKATEIDAFQKNLSARREALTKLPEIASSSLNSLRKLESNLGKAESTLTAIAAGIELITTDLEVSLNGEPLASAARRVITETSELQIGPGTRLRIQPGGGTSLAESKRNVEELRNELALAFDRLSIRNLTEAEEVFLQRQTLEQQIADAAAPLTAMGAKEIAKLLTAASEAHSAAAAEVDRRLATHPVDDLKILPASAGAAREWERKISQARQDSERDEQVTLNEAEQLRKKHELALEAFNSHKETLATARKHLEALETHSRLLESEHGDDTQRAFSLSTANAAATQAKEALDLTDSDLLKLNPASLKSDESRISRAISTQQTACHEAEKRIAVAQSSLALDGTQDPEADVLLARARYSAAQDEHAREERRANAIALLHKLFAETQSAISSSVTQPIADRVAGYLECLFGAGVGVTVDLSGNDRPSIRLTRLDTPDFSFESLSGGAKEQVAAAVRLAMAEILAADHHGCLPVVFDDAFAYADANRVKNLQRMLDLAASRGLQIIVLTCAPADYAGLGANEFRLLGN